MGFQRVRDNDMHRQTLILPLLLALPLAACNESSSTLGPDQGRISIQLTDAPGDLEAAWISIDRIVLIGVEGDDDDDGMIELDPEVTGYINLLDLAGGELLDLVDGEVVPSGDYSELRVYLDEAYVELEDGRVFSTTGADLPGGVEADGELKCPSCSQSGFKVKFLDGGLEVDDDDETTVIIDFDVAQSFGHEAGKSGKWIMHPVLRATTRSVQFARITGNVTLAQGVVLPACGEGTTAIALTQFVPSALLGTDRFLGTVTGATDGAFSIGMLLPGAYTLGGTSAITFSNGDKLTFVTTAAPASVTLTAGQTQTVNYVITSATCTRA